MKWKYEKWLLIISLALFGFVSIIPSILLFNMYLLLISLFITYISLGSLIVEIYFSSKKEKWNKKNIGKSRRMDSWKKHLKH